ncbi:MAG TPA: 50S ribosomal protein L11 methyltransferase [Pyrinomonadaceae bacterium]|jgi:ribosomal protein L11 methyltransferase|nr:50S ribosomal protein L11 methyltransferase [Pyrinomonadaceae bacterium]
MSDDAKRERAWYGVDVRLTPPAREAVEYALMEAGALGTEVSDESGESMRVSAYFDTVPEIEEVRAALFDALRIYGLPTSSVREMELREVAYRDWLGEWKKSWQPVPVGERFLIAPPWSEISNAEGRICIRIEPGMAFGTGTHETTRLCLAAIEKYFTGGSFLDVGTGTGILAIAAAKLFPRALIEACDTDAEAVLIARENARLNSVAEQVSFRVGTVDDETASANLVCANLTADVILPLLPALIGATCGRLILSGILDSQSHLVLSRLHELGIAEPLEISADGEWIAITI